MLKRTVMHKEKLNVQVKVLKSDFANYIYKDKNTNKEYLLAGTLVKAKNGEDLREIGAFVMPTGTGTQAEAVLLHDVEFKYYNDNEQATVSLEGVVYLDKLIAVGKEHPTPITVTKAELPAGVTYIYKDRK